MREDVNLIHMVHWRRLNVVMTVRASEEAEFLDQLRVY